MFKCIFVLVVFFRFSKMDCVGSRNMEMVLMFLLWEVWSNWEVGMLKDKLEERGKYVGVVSLKGM